jgi:hypothetical protein
MTSTVERSGITRLTGAFASRGRASLLAAGLASLLLMACADGPQKRDDAAMLAGGSNVPAAPNVDRSKCSDKGKQVVTVDTNLDKKPDVWKYFTTVQQDGQTISVISCKQVDLNHDGKIDLVSYYDEKGAQLAMEEADLDFDGQFDVTSYYVAGKRVRKEEDTNFDKRPDVWTYYEDDKIVRIERDTDGNGKVDEWQYYEGGKLDRIGYDTSGAGRVDRWDRAPEGEGSGAAGGGGEQGAAATPASGAAAPASGAAAPAAPAATAAKK